MIAAITRLLNDDDEDPVTLSLPSIVATTGEAEGDPLSVAEEDGDNGCDPLTDGLVLAELPTDLESDADGDTDGTGEARRSSGRYESTLGMDKASKKSPAPSAPLQPSPQQRNPDEPCITAHV
jgi:hypothetical protein